MNGWLGSKIGRSKGYLWWIGEGQRGKILLSLVMKMKKIQSQERIKQKKYLVRTNVIFERRIIKGEVIAYIVA